MLCNKNKIHFYYLLNYLQGSKNEIKLYYLTEVVSDRKIRNFLRRMSNTSVALSTVCIIERFKNSRGNF